MNFPSLAFQTRRRLAYFLWERSVRGEPQKVSCSRPTKTEAQDTEKDMVLTLGVIIEAR